MLENLRRKSLTKTYNNHTRQVAFELGYAHYEKHLILEQYKQIFSKKKIDESFPNPFTQVSKKFKLIPHSLGNVKFNMIVCLSGTFTMGHEGQSNNRPRTETIKNSFLLGETEITQELYEKVMGTNPSHFQKKPQNPVEMVSWVDAILFCNELSRLQGLDKCYIENPNSLYGWDYDSSKNGYRLPEEKEWEYAAKAGTQNKWVGTDNEDELGKYAWWGENSNWLTHPVATKKPNKWGFYDMSGNVDEWCWDKYNPKGATSVNRVISRGGSWSNISPALCSAYRNDNSPSNRSYNLGFRVARSIVN